MEVVVVESKRYRKVVDIRELPPKHAISILSTMKGDVATMKLHLVTVYPRTNTIFDAQQLADRLGQVALDSRHVDEFEFSTECPCEAGGSCCQVGFELSVFNPSDVEELPVYTDHLITSDARVQPTHRTFSVVSISQSLTIPGAIIIETDVEHTFDDGDLVTVLDSVTTPPLPKRCKAVSCTSKTIVAVGLFDEPISIEHDVTFEGHTEMVGHVTNRQLLYYLAPKECLAIKMIARKGTGRLHTKWSPMCGDTGYRPLMRGIEVSDAKLTPKLREELTTTVCPVGVFDMEDMAVVVANEDDCIACRRCEEWACDRGVEGAVSIPQNRLAKWHRFRIQTNKSITAETAFIRACQLISETLRQHGSDAAENFEYPVLGPG